MCMGEIGYAEQSGAFFERLKLNLSGTRGKRLLSESMQRKAMQKHK